MGSLTAHFDVPLSNDAPRQARATSAAILATWGYVDPAWCSRAALVVSELVTNAVEHAGGWVAVDLEAHDSSVAIAVSDPSPVPPRRRDPDRRGGRGLGLIESLTVGWSVEDHHGGKRVRAELLPYPGR